MLFCYVINYCRISWVATLLLIVAQCPSVLFDNSRFLSFSEFALCARVLTYLTGDLASKCFCATESCHDWINTIDSNVHTHCGPNSLKVKHKTWKTQKSKTQNTESCLDWINTIDSNVHTCWGPNSLKVKHKTWKTQIIESCFD